jgi:hypothetical protein
MENHRKGGRVVPMKGKITEFDQKPVLVSDAIKQLDEANSSQIENHNQKQKIKVLPGGKSSSNENITRRIPSRREPRTIECLQSVADKVSSDETISVSASSKDANLSSDQDMPSLIDQEVNNEKKKDFYSTPPDSFNQGTNAQFAIMLGHALDRLYKVSCDRSDLLHEKGDIEGLRAQNAELKDLLAKVKMIHEQMASDEEKPRLYDFTSDSDAVFISHYLDDHVWARVKGAVMVSCGHGTSTIPDVTKFDVTNTIGRFKVGRSKWLEFRPGSFHLHVEGRVSGEEVLPPPLYTIT